MITILSIIGTRPEAIKMAPVVKEFENHPKQIKSVICLTGQHKEMIFPILTFFKICPSYNLDIMLKNQTLTQLTVNLIEGLEAVVKQVKPDWVLAQGDTTSVFAAALVAHYHKVRFGHVEAGLRTDDKYNPFPEEMNRRMADSLADLFFVPTERNRLALLSEGYPEKKIVITGNTVIDSLLSVASQKPSGTPDDLKAIPFDKKIVLVTAHRRESLGKPLERICLAIKDLSDEFGPRNIHFVYPVHLNPKVRNTVFEILSGDENVSLLDPLDYFSLIYLMRRSMLIMTDSGGIQEEAPSLGVPVLVMRETTERPEGIDAGVAKLIGRERKRIVEEVRVLLEDPSLLMKMSKKKNPYGNGDAAKKIVTALINHSNSTTADFQ